MSARAVYTFKDNTGTFHVYKHSDGHPEGAIEFIKAAFKPGYTRANDLASSFIFANGWPTTTCELTDDYDKYDGSDLEYHYEISNYDINCYKAKMFVISAFKRKHSYVYGKSSYDLIFKGSLEEFNKFSLGNFTENNNKKEKKVELKVKKADGSEFEGVTFSIGFDGDKFGKPEFIDRKFTEGKFIEVKKVDGTYYFKLI